MTDLKRQGEGDGVKEGMRVKICGMTNREAAAELFVTVRTVESTLTRVYAKLGVRSRTQLAAHLQREG